MASARWGQPDKLATFAYLSGIVIAALVSGFYVRARRAHVASLVERAARLEFERDQQALLKRSSTPTRLAS